MSLEDFKGIFWWEWTHRFLGRLLGVVFFVPFVWFAWTGAIRARDWPRMVVLFALGGLQGFVGWWMVESGLETRVSRQPIPAGDPSGRRADAAGRDSVDGAGISARGPRVAEQRRSAAAHWPLPSPCSSMSRCCWARWSRACMPG